MEYGIILPPTGDERTRIFADLAAAVDRELDDDRRWFAANPRRSYRARKAFPTEALRELTVADATCPPGTRAYILVKQVVPGARLRRLFIGPRGYMLPVTEAGTRRLWFQPIGDDAAFAESLLKIEASMRECTQ